MSIHVRMHARAVDEPHRASSPLELLFDLTFVVAVSQVAAQLAHRIAEGHGLESVVPYLMTFFAIWWAWMNFTWFASAYDTDDALYRVFTVVQMAGVLVLAAGVPVAFDHGDYSVVTLGYLIMRIGLVAHWVRAAIEDPGGRATAIRYAIGVSVVQLGWVLRLLAPAEWFVPSMAVLVLADLAVPPWAEARGGWTRWHPHHIAERYGLFVIILLGESVLAATVAVQAVFTEAGVSGALVTVAAAGLLILVALWWIYYLEPAGDGLARHRPWAFFWGYGHWFLFAALAAIGAALEVAAEVVGHHAELDARAATFAVAAPVAVVLALVWLLHLPLVRGAGVPVWVLLPGAALVLATPLIAPVVGMPAALLAIAGVLVAVIVVATLHDRRRTPTPA